MNDYMVLVAHAAAKFTGNPAVLSPLLDSYCGWENKKSRFCSEPTKTENRVILNVSGLSVEELQLAYEDTLKIHMQHDSKVLGENNFKWSRDCTYEYNVENSVVPLLSAYWTDDDFLIIQARDAESPFDEVLGVKKKSPPAKASGIEKESLFAEASDVGKDSPLSEASNVGKESPFPVASDVGEESSLSEASNIGKESPFPDASDVGEESPLSEASNVGKESPLPEASGVNEESLLFEASDAEKKSSSAEVKGEKDYERFKLIPIDLINVLEPALNVPFLKQIVKAVKKKSSDLSSYVCDASEIPETCDVLSLLTCIPLTEGKKMEFDLKNLQLAAEEQSSQDESVKGSQTDSEDQTPTKKSRKLSKTKSDA